MTTEANEPPIMPPTRTVLEGELAQWVALGWTDEGPLPTTKRQRAKLLAWIHRIAWLEEGPPREVPPPRTHVAAGPAAKPRRARAIASIRQLKEAWADAIERADEKAIHIPCTLAGPPIPLARTRAKDWSWLPGSSRGGEFGSASIGNGMPEVDGKESERSWAPPSPPPDLASINRFLDRLSPVERAVVDAYDEDHATLATRLRLSERQVRRAVERVNRRIVEHVMSLEPLGTSPAAPTSAAVDPRTPATPLADPGTRRFTRDPAPLPSKLDHRNVVF